MKKGEFIQASKKMLVEYFNKQNEFKKITQLDISIIGFCEDKDNYRSLLVIPGLYGIYYEVAYNKQNNKMISYVFKKVGKRINKKVSIRYENFKEMQK